MKKATNTCPISKPKLTVGCVIEEPGSTIINKTGGWRTLRPIKDESKCTKCHICWQFCPDAAIDTNINFNYDYCKGCGICEKVCPLKCIRMEKEEK